MNMDLPVSSNGTQNAAPNNMSKIPPLTLSDRDKTPAASSWGYDFHHTDPQRRVLCVLGDILAPKSADDIPPITPEAMTCVQAAITLLANLVGDRDHGRFLGAGDVKLAENHEKARIIADVGRGLAGILRLATPSASIEGHELPAVDAPARAADHALLAEMRQHHATNDARSIGKQAAAWDLVYDNLGRLLNAYERALLENIRLRSARGQQAGQPPADGPIPGAADNPVTILPPVLIEEYLRRTGWDEPQLRSATFATFRKGLTWLDVPVYGEHFEYPKRFRELLSKLSRIESRSVATVLNDIATTSIPRVTAPTVRSPLIDLQVTLSSDEITALSLAHEHVRKGMAHQYGWKDRDMAMEIIGKVRRVVADQSVLQLSVEAIGTLAKALDYMGTCMDPLHSLRDRDALSAIGKVLAAAQNGPEGPPATGSAPPEPDQAQRRPYSMQTRGNSMPRTFKHGPGPHSFPNHIQYAIQARDMSYGECRLMKCIITNNIMNSADYRACNPAGVFMQGFTLPDKQHKDGWVLVEFWCSDEAMIVKCVEHINRRFKEWEDGGSKISALWQ
jgi:hypothetical protein